MADFYEMDFIKGIAILVKVDEMYNILKSAIYCLLVERWDENVWSKFFGWRYPHTFTMSPFDKGQTSSRKRYSCRERSSYCNIDDTEIR